MDCASVFPEDQYRSRIEKYLVQCRFVQATRGIFVVFLSRPVSYFLRHNEMVINKIVQISTMHLNSVNTMTGICLEAIRAARLEKF